jgi:hypothetical protein
MAHRQSHTSERGWLTKGVKEANYVKGQTSRSNTAGRRGRYDRLPLIAADLVRALAH